MTTSRADLFAGADMEGGEGFCDSIYNILKNHFYGAAAPGSPENGTMYLADDGFTYIYFDAVWYKLVGATGAAWSKTIGATGDYATWAAMIADMPDMIAHSVTVEIELGTTLSEICALKNKHGLTTTAQITVQAEDYFPQAGVIPTATGGTPTTLVDGGQAWAIDRFIDCWVFIVDGTGTDNGFVKITDSNATSVTVAAWPGAQPDATSRYIIVGALIDATGISPGFDVNNDTCYIYFKGIGVKDADAFGFQFSWVSRVNLIYCGVFNCDETGIHVSDSLYIYLLFSALVKNNTVNSVNYAGINFQNVVSGTIYLCGISDNNQRGILSRNSSFVQAEDNFGDGNGAWGLYADRSGQAKMIGAECSGAGGNHSDPGTAGNPNADQASAY